MPALTDKPRTLSDPQTPSEFWELSLEEVVRTALANSEVMRNLGARVIKAPTTTATATTAFDPAISESDPLSGTQAALSEFDAEFTTRMFYSHANQNSDQFELSLEQEQDPLLQKLFHLRDLIFHHHPSETPGFAVPGLSSDFYALQMEVAKKAATGTQFSVTNSVFHFNATDPGGFGVDDAGVAFQVLHPLLKGGGTDYNRIAGSSAIPGRYNGVLLARINTDISLTDFELAVTNFVHDVEVAYWDLQFAYRDLDAKIAARDTAVKLWRAVHRRFEEGDVDADDEAAALEQYYIFQAEVQNALVGMEASRTIDLPTRGGVYRSERRLRELMGLTANDGRLIRPATDPVTARVTFDWSSMLTEALESRVEVRRQKWLVKRRELELTASRNEILPRLDVFARYRASYLGSEFLNQNIDGDVQRASAGIQFSVPLGRRQGYAALRNAELQLAREHALLADQELQVSHELSAAVTEADRAYHLVETSYRRLEAVRKQIDLRRRRYEEGDIPLQFLLDTMLRSIEAESTYITALIDYNVALANVQRERGVLLSHNGIQLNEGRWPDQAYDDAWDQTSRWETAKRQNVHRLPDLSIGPIPQSSPVEFLPPSEPDRTSEGLIGAPPEPGVHSVERTLSSASIAPTDPSAIEASQPLPPGTIGSGNLGPFSLPTMEVKINTSSRRLDIGDSPDTMPAFPQRTPHTQPATLSDPPPTPRGDTGRVSISG